MSQLKTMIFTLMMLTSPLAGCTGDDPADFGCTNTDANNYNENVTKDDGSCDFDLDLSTANQIPAIMVNIYFVNNS